jgi:hypothetical protein
VRNSRAPGTGALARRTQALKALCLERMNAGQMVGGGYQVAEFFSGEAFELVPNGFELRIGRWHRDYCFRGGARLVNSGLAADALDQGPGPLNDWSALWSRRARSSAEAKGDRRSCHPAQRYLVPCRPTRPCRRTAASVRSRRTSARRRCFTYTLIVNLSQIADLARNERNR